MDACIFGGVVQYGNTTLHVLALVVTMFTYETNAVMNTCICICIMVVHMYLLVLALAFLHCTCKTAVKPTDTFLCIIANISPLTKTSKIIFWKHQTFLEVSRNISAFIMISETGATTYCLKHLKLCCKLLFFAAEQITFFRHLGKK